MVDAGFHHVRGDAEVFVHDGDHGSAEVVEGPRWYGGTLLIFSILRDPGVDALFGATVAGDGGFAGVGEEEALVTDFRAALDDFDSRFR